MRLGLVVFLAGAGTLSTEIGASRLLAPYFGSSTVVWANIIGLILVYLSLGYWLGGKAADRWPSPLVLGRVILVAALFVAATPFAARPLLDFALEGLDAVSVGAVVGSFFAALLLFAVPVTLLGTVSPWAIRLDVRDVASAGSVSGRLYALSTAGSILGTFTAALVTIPLAGTQRTFVGTALLLALAAAALMPRRWLVVAVGIGALLAVPAGAVKARSGVLFEAESRYQYVEVRREPDGSRVLQLNEGVAVHSVWRRDTVLTGGYWDLFDLVPPLLGAPGAVAARDRQRRRHDPPRLRRALSRDRDRRRRDRSRRDRGGTEAPRPGRQPAPARDRRGRAALPAVDGEAVRHRGGRRLPAAVRALLPGDEGVLPARARAPASRAASVALNVAATPSDRRLTHALAASLLAGGFAQAWTWPALRYNDLLLGSDAARDRAPRSARRAGDAAPAVRSLVPLFRSQLRPARPADEPLTDDRAPVEWLTDRMIFEQIARGEPLDERTLPTAP